MCSPLCDPQEGAVLVKSSNNPQQLLNNNTAHTFVSTPHHRESSYQSDALLVGWQETTASPLVVEKLPFGCLPALGSNPTLPDLPVLPHAPEASRSHLCLALGAHSSPHVPTFPWSGHSRSLHHPRLSNSTRAAKTLPSAQVALSSCKKNWVPTPRDRPHINFFQNKTLQAVFFCM